MDHDVMWKRVNELWKMKPMLDEAFDRWEAHRKEVDARAESDGDGGPESTGKPIPGAPGYVPPNP